MELVFTLGHETVFLQFRFPQSEDLEMCMTT